MNNSAAHQELLDDVMFEFGSRPNVRVWPRRVGLAENVNTGNVTYYGIKGETDLDGLVEFVVRDLSIAIRLAVEIKTGTARLSPSQKTWRAMCEKFGVIYIEARSVKQACHDLDRAIAFIKSTIGAA